MDSKSNADIVLIEPQSVVFMITSSEIQNTNNILFVSLFIWK